MLETILKIGARIWRLTIRERVIQPLQNRELELKFPAGQIRMSAVLHGLRKQ